MSSVILLAIVLAWGVVLVPMLLRRHETVSETRSVERFATAMRVLSRRNPTAGREFVMPDRPDTNPSVHVKGAGESEIAGEHDVHGTYVDESYVDESYVEESYAEESYGEDEVRRRLRRTREWSEPVPDEQYERPPAPYVRGHRIVARRRRTLLVLAVVAALQVVGIVLVGPGFWVGQGVCDLLIVGYLVHVRRDVAKARERRDRLTARLREDRVAEPEQPWRRSGSGYAAAAEPPAYLSESAQATREVVIEKAEDGSWHPVPVPPPTYVTAPPAPPRRERPAAEDCAGNDADFPAAGEQGFDCAEFDEYGQRRAVNGW